ncbi:hypothetical protein J6590_013326 [Homalodisca vitripennis]|nr:hypothetical protein J6590_013326 [Homalodisca vitripennis]
MNFRALGDFGLLDSPAFGKSRPSVASGSSQLLGPIVHYHILPSTRSWPLAGHSLMQLSASEFSASRNFRILVRITNLWQPSVSESSQPQVLFRFLANSSLFSPRLLAAPYL